MTQRKGWAFVAAMALVAGMATTALAIEAFQERFRVLSELADVFSAIKKVQQKIGRNKAA